MRKHQPFPINDECDFAEGDMPIPIGGKFARTAHIVGRMMTSTQKHHYVEAATATYGWVIGYVAHSKKDVYQRDIERAFNIRRSSVSKMLALMEKRGLVERVAVNRDARLKKIVLTDKALEIHKIAEEDRMQVEKQLLSGLSNEELSCFVKVLDKLEANAEEFMIKSREDNI